MFDTFAAWRGTCKTARWSGDVIKRPGDKNFNAVSHNRARPEVLFSNLTWRSRGQISSVLLPLLLFAFSIRKCGRHGEWSFTFWQWKYGRKFGVKELDALDRWCWYWKSHLIGQWCCWTVSTVKSSWHSFIWLFWFPILSTAFICLRLLKRLRFAQSCVYFVFS